MTVSGIQLTRARGQFGLRAGRLIRAAALAVCAGTSLGVAPAPGAPPTGETAALRTYQEAPVLAKLVAEGKLPPVARRLPDEPAIVQPLKAIGKYGGTWRKLGAAVSDLQLNLRIGYEPLLRWDQEGKNVIPGVAKSWEMKDDGRTFIFHLRKGMKWSDGQPFTSADFTFTAEYVLRNPDLSLIALTHIKSNNELPTVEAVDPHTVIFRFATPYGQFPRALAFQGMQRDLYLPSHYIRQHLPKFVTKAELDAKMKKAGFEHWSDYFAFITDQDKNPDLPTLAPFQIKVPPPSNRCLAVRNPYYWKVDPEGNQLPYIDEISFSMTFDPTVLNLKALNGETDFQLRKIDAGNFTLFKERGRQIGYRTLVSPSTNPMCVYVNQYSRNEKLRPILQDRRFRLALSHAINREELVDLIYTGLAEPSSGFTIPEDTYHIPGLEKANIEYDPEKAERLLDEVGLKRGPGGMRRLPDGTPFAEILHIYPSEEGMNPDLWQLVADYWREVGLQFAVKHEDLSQSFLQVTAGNSDFWTYTNAGLHWSIEGLWKAPLSLMSYMAPIHGSYYQSGGRLGVKPPPELQRLVDWYLEMRSTPDDARRSDLAGRILKQWAEECYVIGICRGPIVAIVSDRFQNVPDAISYDYRLKSPGYLSIEQFFIDEEAARK